MKKESIAFTMLIYIAVLTSCSSVKNTSDTGGVTEVNAAPTDTAFGIVQGKERIFNK
jgi:PBP1b-binding outer membrane lipoprotein LpoB